MAITKRGDGYQVKWRTLAGKQRGQQCATLKSARKLETEIRDAHAHGREWEPERAAAAEEPTVTDLAEAYQEERRITCKASTLRVEENHLELFLRFLSERSPREAATASVLSRALLAEFHAWLHRPDTGRHGKQRKPQTAAKSVLAVQLFWSWLEESERWPGLIPPPRTIKIPRVPPAAVVAPTWAEMDACVLACAPEGWQRLLATWLRYTGLRSGESMLLLWSDVDIERGLLTIRPEIDKMKVGRVVPLCQPILDEISTWGKREGYLIPTKRQKNCKHHRDPRARDIARAWKRAGVREAVWKQRPDHAFRRGFKSGMLALGAHPDAVDYLQGHGLGEGSRGRYIDGALLPLAETAAKVPRIGGAAGNVVQLPKTWSGA